MNLVQIPLPRGNGSSINGILHLPKKSSSPFVVIHHPHPGHGGNMRNKLVVMLARTFTANGFGVLRFDFRQRNEDVFFENCEDEIFEANSVIEWLENSFADISEIWVAGFSFGAWVAMQMVVRRPEIKKFVAVSPPANLLDFSFWTLCHARGLVLQGNEDKIVTLESVDELVENLVNKSENIDYEILNKGNHFFKNLEEKLMTRVDLFIKRENSQSKK